MNRFSEFDNFLIDLSREVKRSPEKANQIVNKAIQDSNCPYLKEKIRGYITSLSNLKN